MARSSTSQDARAGFLFCGVKIGLDVRQTLPFFNNGIRVAGDRLNNEKSQTFEAPQTNHVARWHIAEQRVACFKP